MQGRSEENVCVSSFKRTLFKKNFYFQDILIAIKHSEYLLSIAKNMSVHSFKTKMF